MDDVPKLHDYQWVVHANLSLSSFSGFNKKTARRRSRKGRNSVLLHIIRYSMPMWTVHNILLTIFGVVLMVTPLALWSVGAGHNVLRYV